MWLGVAFAGIILGIFSEWLRQSPLSQSREMNRVNNFSKCSRSICAANDVGARIQVVLIKWLFGLKYYITKFLLLLEFMFVSIQIDKSTAKQKKEFTYSFVEVKNVVGE